MDAFEQAVDLAKVLAPLGATGLLTVAVLAVLRGWLTPPGVIRREDARNAVDEIRNQTAARIAAEVRRADEYRERANKAEEREEKWRDAWLVSESGRGLAESHVAALTNAMVPVTTALGSEQATRGLDLNRPPNPRP